MTKDIELRIDSTTHDTSRTQNQSCTSQQKCAVSFIVISMVTTTGFSSSSSTEWPFSISFLLLVGAFIGACSGSVGGGVKSWRVMIMLNHAYSNIMKIIHPNSVISLKIGIF